MQGRQAAASLLLIHFPDRGQSLGYQAHRPERLRNRIMEFIRQAVPLGDDCRPFSAIKQAGILNGDGRLIGKALQPFRMGLGEEARGRAVQREKAENRAVAADRGDHVRVYPVQPRKPIHSGEVVVFAIASGFPISINCCKAASFVTGIG